MTNEVKGKEVEEVLEAVVEEEDQKESLHVERDDPRSLESGRTCAIATFILSTYIHVLNEFFLNIHVEICPECHAYRESTELDL
jgi:hypothetical protein